jgi:hypothetical protein
MKQKKFLKQALVLLLMTLMVASSTVVVANTSTPTAAFSANKTTQTSAPLNRDLIWDNVVGVHGSLGGIIVATVRTEGIAFPADDFMLDSAATVDSIFWQGGYFQCQLATGQHDYNWDWRVIFWSDDGTGNHPGAEIYNQTIPDAQITREFWYNYTHPTNGNTYWVANYSVDLPVSISFNANTKYWITIQTIQTPNTYPQGCWSRHNNTDGGIKLHEAEILAAYWGYATWTNISVLVTDLLPHDLNFQLFGGAAQDTTPPVTTCDITGTNPVTITLTATDDDSGVNHTYYKIDDGTYAMYTAPVQDTDVGDHTVYYYSTDLAGNVETEKSTDYTVEAPPLSVTIKGGLGVSVVVKNTGTSDLTNIDWSVNLGGKFILIGKAKSGTIASLAPGDSVTVKDFVVGIGSTSITALVGSEEVMSSGTVLLIFVLGVT